VEFAHSTAEVRRDEALISDRDDERERAYFELVTLADCARANIVKSWGEATAQFSCTFYQGLTIRWLNTGPGHGATMTIGGGQRTGKMFRVCSGCGKLDRDTGLNSPHEHRAWCPHRTDTAEHARVIALSHTLQTQAVVLRLPRSITLADEFALPSLTAAITLGLREHIGGDPDHLGIATIKAPVPGGSGTTDALLIHDRVPGGTGYLTDWADPARLFALFELAWRHVRDCGCRNTSQLACPNCLSPFASGRDLNRVSRAAAERHLGHLLAVNDEFPEPSFERWQLTEDRVVANRDADESVLEHDFRRALIDRLTAMGATVREKPGLTGNTALITLPGTPRQWVLRPQVSLTETRPEFVLETPDTNVADVVIYTDGWQYHASPAHNRIADDAVKRAGLRDVGKVVLSITADDVRQARKTHNAHRGQSVLPSEVIAHAMQEPLLQASPKAYQMLGANPIDWLEAWMTNPDQENLRKAARAVPLAFTQGSQPVSLKANEPLALAAARALSDTGEQTAISDDLSERSVIVWRQGHLAAAIEFLGDQRMAVSLVVDDDIATLTRADDDAWRNWLRFSNAMALRDWPTTVTARSLVEDGQLNETPASQGPITAQLPEQWRYLMNGASEIERALLGLLAEHGIQSPPQLGEEGPEGIPLDLSWDKQKVVIEAEPMLAEDRLELVKNGWTVLSNTTDTIVADLKQAGVT
jgi:hypothetical protein